MNLNPFHFNEIIYTHNLKKKNFFSTSYLYK